MPSLLLLCQQQALWSMLHQVIKPNSASCVAVHCSSPPREIRLHRTWRKQLRFMKLKIRYLIIYYLTK